jgi:2'-5' RNA ligase
MKRLFVAIKVNPDEKFLAQFRILKSSLMHERIKWVEDHNIHITLKFFGETEEAKIPRISAVLRSIASQTKPFSFLLKHLGIFGSSYEPRVIWIGIEPYQELEILMRRIRDQLKPLGFDLDRQNLVPHLTLGRVKSLKDKQLFNRSIERFNSISSEKLKTGSFILFESILKKEGPIYRSLDTFLFSNEDGF